MSERFLESGDLEAIVTSARMQTLGASQVILQPFRQQEIQIEWILAIGFFPPGCSRFAELEESAVLVHLGPDKHADTEIITRIDVGGSGSESAQRPIYNFDTLAQKASEYIPNSAGERAVLIKQSELRDFAKIAGHFRAVCVLLSKDPVEAREVWKLQRDLFDVGFVGIGSVAVADGEVHCFLLSDHVRCVRGLGTGSRGYVSITSLGNNGRFANQMFQYLYVKFYALRHCLAAAIPPWQGNQVFGLEDTSCAGLNLPELRYSQFAEDDLILWRMAEPPINVDLWGYFQEIPACWQKHRALVRRLFQVSAEYRRAIDDWRDEVTLAGKRTLIAVHVRRGDYRDWQSWKEPYFRMIPVDWYVAWLKAIWPTVDSPVLYVATDEPETVLPLFRRI